MTLQVTRVKVGLAVTEDMYQALENEKKTRQLPSIPEPVRVLISESLPMRHGSSTHTFPKGVFFACFRFFPLIFPFSFQIQWCAV